MKQKVIKCNKIVTKCNRNVIKRTKCNRNVSKIQENLTK